MPTIVGDTGDNVLTATGGWTFAGMGGNDVMQGGAGDDQFDFDFDTITGAASGIGPMELASR